MTAYYDQPYSDGFRYSTKCGCIDPSGTSRGLVHCSRGRLGLCDHGRPGMHRNYPEYSNDVAPYSQSYYAVVVATTPKEVPFDQSMRRTAFDGYFAAVMGMSLHPGTTRDLPQHRTPEECRDIALQMLKLRDELVASGVL